MPTVYFTKAPPIQSLHALNACTFFRSVRAFSARFFIFSFTAVVRTKAFQKEVVLFPFDAGHGSVSSYGLLISSVFYVVCLRFHPFCCYYCTIKTFALVSFLSRVPCRRHGQPLSFLLVASLSSTPTAVGARWEQNPKSVVKTC